MSGSALWFMLIAAILPAAWFAGRACGRIKDTLRRSFVLGVAFAMLIGWAVLIKHPALAVQIIPLKALSRLEGIAAAPVFLFMLGVGWHMAVLKRQRAVMIVGMLLGAAYFVQGGLWMMRPTPTNAFEEQSGHLIVHQTQDYSCVPAASATALRLMGLSTTEAEMAELTETRAGSGATLIRALNGLNTRLKHTGITPELLEADYDMLMSIEPPMLTPLQYETVRLHMVTIIEVREDVILIADPQYGLEFVSRRNFEEIYRGQVIAFEGGSGRASTEQVLLQNPHVIDPYLARHANR